MNINIVLCEPEIPQNTGNIARTCAAVGASLHLIKPLGFEIDDRKLKRAGLDYWHLLDIAYYEGLEDFFEKNPDAAVYYFSTKAPKSFSEVTYPEKVYLMFGKETVHLILSERMDAVRDAVCPLNPCGIVIQAEINLFQLRMIFQHPKRGTVGS